MAVTATVTENLATGDGSEQHYTFTFHTLDTAHVKATVDGVAPSFTVALNGDQEASPGGTVTFATAPALNSEVRVYRETAKTQSLSLTPYAKFPATALEGAFDKLALEVQDAQARIDQIKAPLLAGGSGDVTPHVGSQGRLGIYSNPSGDGSTVLGVVVKDPDPATTYSWRAVTGSTDFAGVEATLALHDQRLDALEAGGGGAPVAGTEGFYVTGPGLDGLVGNGIANDGVALQAVLTSNPTRGILLKAGTYNIDGTVLTMSTGQVLAGEGRALTSLVQADADTSMIEMAESCELRDMTLIHDENVTATSGAMIRVFGAARTNFEKLAGRISNLRLIAPFVGVRVDDGAATPGPDANNTLVIGFFANDIVIQTVQFAGMLFRDVVEAHVSNVWIDGITGESSGLYLDGYNQNLNFDNIHIAGCEYGIQSVGAGQDTTDFNGNCNFNNVTVVLANSIGAYLSVSRHFKFTNCTFRDGAGKGVQMDLAGGNNHGHKFIGCTFFNHAGIAFHVTTAASYWLHLNISGCYFGENQAGCIQIAGFTSHFVIQGNQFGNQSDQNINTTTSVPSITIDTGSGDYYIIKDNLGYQQGGGLLLDQGSGVNKSISDNLNYTS